MKDECQCALDHEFDLAGIIARGGWCVRACVWGGGGEGGGDGGKVVGRGVGGGVGRLELCVGNAVMRLFSFLYVAASHTPHFICFIFMLLGPTPNNITLFFFFFLMWESWNYV